MSYHIEINEYQRRLIMKALTSTDVNQFSQAPGSGDAFDTEAKEFVCLVQMFGTLDLDDTTKPMNGINPPKRPDCVADSNSEMSSQIIPLKARADSQDPSRIAAMETTRV